MTQALQFGAALIGLLTAILVAIPAVAKYRERRNNKAAVKKQRSRRIYDRMTRPVPVLIGVSILGVISVLFILQLTRADESGSTIADSLLRQLVSDNVRECESVPSQRDGAIASLRCAMEKPMRTMIISLFGSVSQVEDVEKERLAKLGSKEGDCTTQRVAWQEWTHGKLLCNYSTGVGAHFQWSRYDSKTWLEAEALPEVSPDRVYDWWNYESSGAPANNRLPYPDRYEKYILERTGIPRSECERSPGYKDSLAAVLCRRPGFGHLFFGYYTNGKSLHEALGVKPGKGLCVSEYRYSRGKRRYIWVKREPGRRQYFLKGKPAGTRDCFIRSAEREVIVAWTNQDTGIFGFVKWSDTKDLEKLFRWWESSGRYLTD